MASVVSNPPILQTIAHQAPLLQARILEWVALPTSRRSSWPGIKPAPLKSTALAGRFFTTSIIRKAQQYHLCVLTCSVMSDSLWPHGLQPTRLLCPWQFSGQEYWSGMPCPPPEDSQSTDQTHIFHIAGGFLTTWAKGKGIPYDRINLHFKSYCLKVWPLNHMP